MDLAEQMRGRRRWSNGVAWPLQQDDAPRHDGQAPERVDAVGAHAEEFPITCSLIKQKEGFYILQGQCKLCTRSFTQKGCVQATGQVSRFKNHSQKLGDMLHHARTEHGLQGEWFVYRDLGAKDPRQRLVWSTDESKAATANAGSRSSLMKASWLSRAVGASQGAALPALEGPAQNPPLDDGAESEPPAKRTRIASCHLRVDTPAKALPAPPSAENPAADDDGQPADAADAGARQFACPLCSRVYQTSGWLYKHIIKSHPDHNAALACEAGAGPLWPAAAGEQIPQSSWGYGAVRPYVAGSTCPACGQCFSSRVKAIDHLAYRKASCRRRLQAGELESFKMSSEQAAVEDAAEQVAISDSSENDRACSPSGEEDQRGPGDAAVPVFPVECSLVQHKLGFWILRGDCRLCGHEFHAMGSYVRTSCQVKRFNTHAAKQREMVEHVQQVHHIKGDWEAIRQLDQEDPLKRLIWRNLDVEQAKAEVLALEDIQEPPVLSPQDAGQAPSVEHERQAGKQEEVEQPPVPSDTSNVTGGPPSAAEAELEQLAEPLEMDVSPKVVGRAPLVVVPRSMPLPPRALLPKDAILRREALLPEDAVLQRQARQGLQPQGPEVFPTTVAEATAAGIEAPPAWPGLGVVPEELRTGFRSLLVVGPSGSGKTTLLRAILSELFPDYDGSIYPHGEWAPDLPLIDAFETAEEGRDLLSSVGLCSVPSWCKPFSVLSVGEQYRANVALALRRRRQAPQLPLVLDEWTSELDRDLARNVSLALGKRLRRESEEAEGGKGPYIFATCHEDTIWHLQPELICRCAVGLAPQVMRNPHAGAVPHLSAVLMGEPNHTEVRKDGDLLCGPWAVEGATEMFTIRPYLPIPGDFVVANFGSSVSKINNIRRSDDGQPGEETQGAEAFPGPWYANECEGSEWHFRLRLLSRDAMQLVHSYVEGGTTHEQELKVVRLQVLRHTQAAQMAADPSSAKSRGRSFGYEDVDTSALERVGWYLPPEFQQDALYTGLQRSCEPLRVRSSDALGDDDPDAEEQKYYLAAYVGKAGYLSSKLYDVSRLLDCPFDGLCVHEVPSLPSLGEFSVGVITGPSGSGKSSLLRKLFGPCPRVAWAEEPVLAHFASLARARELCGAACLDLGVAMRPFGSLSAGEQARASLARLLDAALPAEEGGEARRRRPLVLEEFTSLVDRALAKRLARSMQRLVATRGLQVVVVSCHRDFVAAGLLEPEWVFECHSDRLLRFRTAASELAQSVAALRRSLDEARAAESRSELLLQRLQMQAAEPCFSEAFRAEAAEALESLGARELEQRREEIASLNQRIAEAYSESRAAPPAADEVEAPEPEASPAPAAPETLALQLVVRRALVCEWSHFMEHHYKDHKIKVDSVAFVGLIADRVACFIAMCRDPLNFVNRAAVLKRLPEGLYPSAWLEAAPPRLLFREHRTVVLPDFQGMGLAPLLCDTVAAYVHSMGHDFTSQTIHPFYGSYRDRSPFWRPMHTNRTQGSAIKGNLKYSHFFVGATRADGSRDPELHQQLAARAVLEP